MARALALKTGKPEFKTRSDHSLNLFQWSLVQHLSCTCKKPTQPAGIRNCCLYSVPSIRCVSLALKSPNRERSIKYVLLNS